MSWFKTSPPPCAHEFHLDTLNFWAPTVVSCPHCGQQARIEVTVAGVRIRLGDE